VGFRARVPPGHAVLLDFLKAAGAVTDELRPDQAFAGERGCVGREEAEGGGQPGEVGGAFDQEVARLELHVTVLVSEVEGPSLPGVEGEGVAGLELSEQGVEGVELGVSELDGLVAVAEL
jgi:hypothetical protein